MKLYFSFISFFLGFGCFLFGENEKEIFKTVTPEFVGMDSKKLQWVDTKMNDLVANEKLVGGIVMVARQGKVAHFGTYGLRDREKNLPMEKDTIFRIYSMTKAITSVAALMLEEDGKLNLNDSISKYFPSLKKNEGVGQNWSGCAQKGGYGCGFA